MHFDELKSSIAKHICDAASVPLEAAFSSLELPKSGQADLACKLAFSLAKERKTSPIVLAKELASKIKLGNLGTVTAEGPYINISLAPEVLLECATYSSVPKKHSKKKKAVVEFSSPNLGKPLHVGHLRGTIYGEAVAHLLESTGYDVVRMNYLGDSGTQVAKLMYALEHYTNLPKPTDEKAIVQYYIQVSNEEENKEVQEEVRTIVEAIESADLKIQKRLSYVREVSLNSFNRLYSKLGISFDEFVGESQFVAPSKRCVEECVSHKLASLQENGSMLLELEPHGLPNTIIMRSNQTTLYLTRDLALADYKYAKYHFDLSFICTAAEQVLHFKQLFLTMKLLGRPYADKMVHTGFGTVISTAGKFSTRKGNMILLEDVIDEVIELADAEIKTRNEAPSKELASTIGLGSLKFAFLRISADKSITFDPKQAVSFEGDTGAYVQYAYVRCLRILEKSSEKAHPHPVTLVPEERALAHLLCQYQDTVENAAKNFAPHTVCGYLLKLSATFSSFYAACRVNDAESKEIIQTRRALVKATAEVIKNGLSLLGIGVPERM